MLVSIIIVNYNTFQLTCNCIESLRKHTKALSYEIILVDNASTEINPDGFKSIFPEISLIKSPDNGGFAKGNNLGLAHAKGDILLLLNSDTLMEEDAVSKAACYLRANPRIGALTVGLYYADGRTQHYARRFKALKYELLDLVRPFLYLLPYQKRAQLMLNQYYNNDFDVACDWIGGAFFMMQKNALEDLGGRLDERYFMYGEDQLWCMQLADKGWEVHCFAGTRIVHLEGGSDRMRGKKRWNGLLLRRELELYRLRNGAGISYRLFSFVFTLKRAGAFALLKLTGK